ncbi:hypothetical protein VULLAG_LOCUS15834 [Vulpes lagopus]
MGSRNRTGLPGGAARQLRTRDHPSSPGSRDLTSPIPRRVLQVAVKPPTLRTCHRRVRSRKLGGLLGSMSLASESLQTLPHRIRPPAFGQRGCRGGVASIPSTAHGGALPAATPPGPPCGRWARPGSRSAFYEETVDSVRPGPGRALPCPRRRGGSSHPGQARPGPSPAPTHSSPVASGPAAGDSAFALHDCGRVLLSPELTEGGFSFHLLGVAPNMHSIYNISFFFFFPSLRRLSTPLESGLSRPRPARRAALRAGAAPLPPGLRAAQRAGHRAPSRSPPGFLEGRARPHFRRARPEALQLPAWGPSGSQPSQGTLGAVPARRRHSVNTAKETCGNTRDLLLLLLERATGLAGKADVEGHQPLRVWTLESDHFV